MSPRSSAELNSSAESEAGSDRKKKKETEGIRVYKEETEVTVLSYMYVMR